MTLPDRTQGNLQLSVCPESIRKLRDRVPRRYNLGRDAHIALLYGAFREEWIDHIGREALIIVTSNAWSDRVQALRIDLPTEIECFCQDRVPHLVISWVDGATPDEANSLFFSKSRVEDWFPDNTFYLRCLVGFTPWKVKEGDRHE